MDAPLPEPSIARSAYVMRTFSSLPTAVAEEKRIPGQSLAAGLLAEPSPFVSPATASSWNEVNTIGCAYGPTASKVPLTSSRADFLNLTTVPGSIVRVAPLATVTVLSTTISPRQVVSAAIVPETCREASR